MSNDRLWIHPEVKDNLQREILSIIYEDPGCRFIPTKFILEDLKERGHYASERTVYRKLRILSDKKNGVLEQRTTRNNRRGQPSHFFRLKKERVLKQLSLVEDILKAMHIGEPIIGPPGEAFVAISDGNNIFYRRYAEEEDFEMKWEFDRFVERLQDVRRIDRYFNRNEEAYKKYDTLKQLELSNQIDPSPDKTDEIKRIRDELFNSNIRRKSHKVRQTLLFDSEGPKWHDIISNEKKK